jgi:hypothetical protein
MSPSREQERAALMRVIETFPPSMDLPTVLWGASAALLALRDVAEPERPTYTMGPGGGSWSDGWGEERPPVPPMPEASHQDRDERLCLTHMVQRWVCVPLQGPGEFCISVVPCKGCGDDGEHYHTSDGQSHDGPAPVGV